jgi:hypothetical protein
MLGVTLFGIFLTPVFFSVVQALEDRRPAAAASTGDTTPPHQSAE